MNIAAGVFYLLSLIAMTNAFSLRPNRGLITHRYVSGGLQMMAEQLGVVTMYKKDSCPFCKKAKALLEDTHGLTVTYVDVEEPDT